jgi:hypothetical protein
VRENVSHPYKTTNNIAVYTAEMKTKIFLN